MGGKEEDGTNGGKENEEELASALGRKRVSLNSLLLDQWLQLILEPPYWHLALK